MSASDFESFAGARLKRWQNPNFNADFRVAGWTGSTVLDIEVVLLFANSRPTRTDVREVWDARWNKRSTGVLAVVAYETPTGRRASIAGLRSRRVVNDVELELVERLAEQALLATSSSSAEQLIEQLFGMAESDNTPGLSNHGLFATHELEHNVRARGDWALACERAKTLRGVNGSDVLTALGWQVQTRGSTLLLSDAENDHAVAVVLEGNEIFDRPTQRYQMSPVEFGLMVAQKNRLDWVVAVQGSVLRLYTANPDVGIGRKGAQTYTEINLALLDDQSIAYADLLLSPAALRPGGSVEQILQASQDHAAELGSNLRERVYSEVVDGLAQTIADQLGDKTREGLDRAYHNTLVVLFRMLFIAYAEDGGLLPYRTNVEYTHHAFKTKARTFADRLNGDGSTFDRASADLWHTFADICVAISDGHGQWGIPPYGGGLFDPNTQAGEAISQLELNNEQFGPALQWLLVDEGDDGFGPVDFQALSVREFGTIYEGLLESSLSLAPVDLTLGRNHAFIPASDGDDVVVQAGAIYLHNASGARKSTGSYFTKQFAVEHLLETALDPTLDEHLVKVAELLDVGDEAAANTLLFEFRVADLAMGSGHFLVAAIDHIGARISAFLSEHAMAGTNQELNSLREAAIAELDRVQVTEVPQIGQMDLVRRQVARRCIYGIDVNEIAVELARLAVWIHTFVPGLPMSNLGHGLIHGNSLTGIGSVDELLESLGAGGSNSQSTLGLTEIEDALAAAAEPIARAARISEATLTESLEAAALHAEATELLKPLRFAMDAVIAARLDMVDIRAVTLNGFESLVDAGRQESVQVALNELKPTHFPVAFPEVFNPRSNSPGFDVVLGNPPWDKLHVEKHQGWALRLPGIRGLSDTAMNKRISEFMDTRPDLVEEFEFDISAVAAQRDSIAAGPYPGIGSGHLDLYKAFVWRSWACLSELGRLGLVLPRGTLQGSGTAPWRRTILTDGRFESVAVLSNTRHWVFSEVHAQSTIALVTVARARPNGMVRFDGPYHSEDEFRRVPKIEVQVSITEFESWSETAAFPLLPNADTASIFTRMRESPSFRERNANRFRPVQGDVNQSKEKWLFAEPAAQNTPVIKGECFDLWNPDAATYMSVDQVAIEQFLLAKRANQIKLRNSAFYGQLLGDAEELPFHRARIAFRDVTNQTNSRTMVCALVPPHVVLTHKAPYLQRLDATEHDEAYLLGVISSIPFDWYTRRYVELSFTFELLNPMPIPSPVPTDSRRIRVAEISGRLAARDSRFEHWAKAVGAPIGVDDEMGRSRLTAELDALVGLLYGLERDQMVRIFETFHRGWDYTERLELALKYFDTWESKS